MKVSNTNDYNKFMILFCFNFEMNQIHAFQKIFKLFTRDFFIIVLPENFPYVHF
jgi:hypothetical protein